MQGEHDTPLNKNGKELARITARALEDVPFDLAISSPLSRALETRSDFDWRQKDPCS